MDLERVSVGATMALVAAVVVLLLRHSLFAHRPAFVTAQVLAALLMLWARATFGWRSFQASARPTAGGLVTGGPYRWIRHPIYLAILLFVWAGAASHGSTPSVLIAIVATAAIAVRIVAEEHLVADRYPEYVEYARRTKRIIPFVL